jgi:threonine 3-dehydrogenase
MNSGNAFAMTHRRFAVEHSGSMATCLITGGAGNLGCQLARSLATRFEHIVLFDVAAAPIVDVASFANFEQGDLTNESQLNTLFSRYRPTVVIHLAALLSGSCERDRNLGWKVNATGTFSLLEAAIRHGNPMVIFLSSVAAFGGELPGVLTDDTPQWPDGIYGVTKMAGERLGVYYRRQHGMDFRCLRLPITVSRFAPAGAISALASHAFIEGTARGQFIFRCRQETKMALMYVEDVMQAILDLSAAPPIRLTREVYNIHGFTASSREIADAITRQLPHANFEFRPDPKTVALLESWPSQIDDSAARADWNWEPRYDLERMAYHFIQEIAELPQGVRGS